MAQAARRIEREAPRARRAHLSVVPAVRVARKPARKPARAGAREARYRAAFTTVVALAIALAAVGLLRVAVVARATEMTLSESALAASIKAQRIETDRLEIDRSSLATPSRIEEVASQSMGMGRPASVRYITMPGETAAPAEGATPAQGATSAGSATTETGNPADAAGSAVRSVIGALADMSAVEAQALLVGEVGLTGSR